MDDKATVEYYADPMQVRLVGAVEVPGKRMMEAAQNIGKVICKTLGVNTLDALLLDGNGDEIDRIVVWR